MGSGNSGVVGMSKEQENNYNELIALKDEEINLLKEDKVKKEQMI